MCIGFKGKITSGNVKGGWTGDVACDSYNRFAEDVAIMKQKLRVIMVAIL